MKSNDSLKSLMALVLVLGLTSCQTSGTSSNLKESSGSSETTPAIHEHTFAEEWSKDETHHWKASTCGHADAETKAEHTFGEPVEVVEGTAGTRTWTCSGCEYEKVEAITSLVVNYRLPDGTLIDSTTQEVKQGEAYSVASPKVKFMAPSKAVVEGTMDADGEVVDVVYDYSSDAMETQVSPGRDMGKLYVDEKNKIISISDYVIGDIVEAEIEDFIDKNEFIESFNKTFRLEEDFEVDEVNNVSIVKQIEDFCKKQEFVLPEGWKVMVAKKYVQRNKTPDEIVLSKWKELFDKIK